MPFSQSSYLLFQSFIFLFIFTNTYLDILFTLSQYYSLWLFPEYLFSWNFVFHEEFKNSTLRLCLINFFVSSPTLK